MAGDEGPILAVNIGNTRTAVGLVGRDASVVAAAFATTGRCSGEECRTLVASWLGRVRGNEPWPRLAAIASVVPPLTPLWRDALMALGLGRQDIRVYGEDGGLGIRVRMAMPALSVGADRLLNAIAARRLCGAPALVVDVGTATTLDVVAGDGAFVGGAIAPGPVTAAEGLFRRAPSLAPVAVAHTAGHAVGATTEEALQSGVTLGHAGQIAALVERARQELGAPSAPVVMTGGLGAALAPELPFACRIEPWLTLYGLFWWAEEPA